MDSSISSVENRFQNT
jgi:hypothetical protein